MSLKTKLAKGLLATSLVGSLVTGGLGVDAWRNQNKIKNNPITKECTDLERKIQGDTYIPNINTYKETCSSPEILEARTEARKEYLKHGWKLLVYGCYTLGELSLATFLAMYLLSFSNKKTKEVENKQ